MAPLDASALATASPRLETKSYPRGFANPPQLRTAIAWAHRTRLWHTCALGLADALSIIIICVGVGWLWRHTAVAALVLAPLAAVVVGRQLRALECLVHEASHVNWCRRRRTVNDLLATVIASLPTGAALGPYRTAHLLHHGRFGTDQDPDLQRYRELDLEDLDRANAARFAGQLARRFVAYQRGWVAAISASPATLALPLAWAGLAVVVPGWLLGGPACALAALIVWTVGYGLVLPVVRFIGESSEHVYREADTVFDATVSNLGLVQRLLFHPHGDGYHTIHHLWPGVPHHRIARLHRMMVENDDFYAANLLMRSRLLERPTRAWQRATAT